MKHTLLIVASFLILSACSADADQRDPDGGTTLLESATSSVSDRIGDTEWILASGSVDGTALVLVDGSPVTLQQAANGISGRSACNSYGAQLNEAGGPLFEEMFSTAMACADPRVNELEILATQGLMQVTEAELDVGDLVFLGDGVELRFAPDSGESPVGLEETTWTLDSLILGDAVSTPVAPGEITISPGLITGFAGCNDFSGEVTIGIDTMIATEIISNAAGCEESIMLQEQTIFRILRSQPTWRIEGNHLTLMSGDEGVIFRSAPYSPPEPQAPTTTAPPQ